MSKWDKLKRASKNAYEKSVATGTSIGASIEKANKFIDKAEKKRRALGKNKVVKMLTR